MKYRTEFEALVRHAHLLRSSMNLVYDRQQQLEQTMRGLGFSSVPRDHKDFTRLQVQAAKEIGGIHTRILLDAPQEIEKFHWGPLQISLCLLYAVIERYKQLCKINPTFQDDALDKYCRENHQFVELLEALRDSILHQRYDNEGEQVKFVEKFTGDGNRRLKTLLIEGESAYKDYLRRLWHLLQEDDRKRMNEMILPSVSRRWRYFPQ